MNPVELMLFALAACMPKVFERVTPLLDINGGGFRNQLEAIREDAPSCIAMS
jgi:hypothetical protein